MKGFLADANADQAKVIALIRELVECESPSDSPRAVNHFVDLLIERTKDVASASRVDGGAYGDHVRLECAFSDAEGQILVLGHSDTVWPAGTIRSMPFREAAGRLWGPGVLDMKAGLAFAISAMHILKRAETRLRHRIVLLVVSDEEIGSPASRPLIEAEARKSEYVLVLEPGSGLTGHLKTARKGVGRYVVRVHGVSAHAGIDFEKGASAILEAAKQVQAIAAFADPAAGITLNPGVISGGTRSNVVAAQAVIEVDVRIPRMSQVQDIDRRMRALSPVDPGCRIEVEGGINRPPMERTQGVASLFSRARDLAREGGIEIAESSTGGASDGNFTAAMGIPTLDGLGAVGEGAHASHESILTARIADRIALLTALLHAL